MKNVIMLAGILAMVSCGTSEGECSHENSTTDSLIIINDGSSNLDEVEDVTLLLDSLDSTPSDSVIVE